VVQSGCGLRRHRFEAHHQANPRGERLRRSSAKDVASLAVDPRSAGKVGVQRHRQSSNKPRENRGAWPVPQSPTSKNPGFSLSLNRSEVWAGLVSLAFLTPAFSLTAKHPNVSRMSRLADCAYLGSVYNRTPTKTLGISVSEIIRRALDSFIEAENSKLETDMVIRKDNTKHGKSN